MTTTSPSAATEAAPAPVNETSSEPPSSLKDTTVIPKASMVKSESVLSMDKTESSENDEEEQFMQSLEREEEENRLKEDVVPQDKEAPKLLRDALGGEPKEKKIKVKEEEEKKGEVGEDKDPKESQLDFLLSKATEYSNFIAADLDELQQQMAEQAEKELNKGKKRKRKTKNGSKELEKAQAKYESGKRPIFIQPPNLSKGCVLKDYQLEGVRWLTSLYENGVSGILADEMGLGKTIQVIALIAHLRNMKVTGPFLVVVPLATLPNWIREFTKWLPSLPVIRYHGPGAERERMLKGPLHPRNKKSDSFPVIVTSYEISIKDHAKLNKIGEFTYVVVDEGQRLKNHRCTLIHSLKAISAANRLLLSGTPIQNNLDELWSLLNFVNPQIFDDLSVFQSWFGFRDIGTGTKEAELVKEQQEKNTVSKLHEILRPFLLRRIKRDVLTDMPPKKELVVYAGMSKLQCGYHDMIEKGVLRDELIRQGIEGGRTLSQTNKQMNHRKNSNHPFIFGEPIDPNTGMHLGTVKPELLIRASGKFNLLDRMLDKLFVDKHQVLIFSQMTAVLNVMEDYLIWRNWKYCRIDGNTKIDERQRQMDVFNQEKVNGKDGGRNDSDDRHFVFLLSTRAGGLGINLASADTCIIFDSDWNPHQDSQAMDRCHRIGQNRPVAVYRLLSAGSVDIEMMEKQMSKKKLERMAIAGGDFRKAGQRSKGDFSIQKLSSLLEDDIKDFENKGGDVGLKIEEEEFAAIMDRKTLFDEGPTAIPTEGTMYDILDANGGDALGAMVG